LLKIHNFSSLAAGCNPKDRRKFALYQLPLREGHYGCGLEADPMLRLSEGRAGPLQIGVVGLVAIAVIGLAAWAISQP